jgi:steroid delta-isomerase-like uncharacterized protein
MAAADLRELMDRWVAAWNDHDVDAMAACLAEDVLYIDPGARPDPVLRGPEAVKEFARSLWRSSPDLTFEVLELFTSDDGRVVTMHWRTTGTFSEPLDPPGFGPTRGRIVVEGYDRNEVRDGLFVKHEAFYDQFSLGSQIGAVPRPGSLGERIGLVMQRLAAWRMRRSGT